MHRTAAVLALLLGLAAYGAGAEPPPRDAAGTAEAYAGVVSLYRAGHTAEAISALNHWKPYEIEAAANAFPAHSGLSTGSQCLERRVAEAAVLLHADAALLCWLQDAPVEHELHLRLALERIQQLPNASADGGQNPSLAPIMPRELYVALAAAELAVMSPLGAEASAERGLASFPGDPDLLLLAGVAEETLALAYTHAGHERGASAAQRKARNHFAAAYAIAPAFEMRLRFGRTWARLGRAAEAQPILESALASASDPRQRYLAELFLGRVHEMRGRPRLAEQAYRAALEQAPKAQAARIALAHVLETMAGPNRARPLVGEMLRDSPRTDRSADPWWEYPFGPPELRLQPLGRLRQRVQSP